MARIICTVTDETEKALKEIAEGRGAPVSTLIREAIQDYLVKQGKDVNVAVTWGGSRGQETKEE